MNRDMNIDEIKEYTRQKLKKHSIVDPALYLDPGLYPLTKIPHNITDVSSLNIEGENFRVLENDSFTEIKIANNESFFIINKKYLDPKSQSRNTHIKFGYGKTGIYNDKLYQLPWLENNGKADNERATWWEECKNSARLIEEKYQDVAVMLSGGLDSLSIAASFIDAGIKFRPYFMKYYNTEGEIINSYDYNSAINFCNQHNLTLDTEDIDLIEDIFNYRHYDYKIEGIWETYPIISALYTHCHAIEKFNKLGFLPIFGTDGVELKMDADNNPSIGDSSYCSGHWPVFWAHEKNLDFVYNFMSYTTNQVLAYLDLDEIKNAKEIGYNLKSNVIQKYGSKSLNLDLPKRTGYEDIRPNIIKLGKGYHDFTMENVDNIDWSKKPTKQYIHNIDHVLQNNEMNQYKIINITVDDWFVSGFKQNVPDYYN